MSLTKTNMQTELYLGEKAQNLLLFANEKRKSGSFNDINIQVGNDCFPCNKMILSCYSTYFEIIFRTEMQERYQDTVKIQQFDGKIIKMLIEYMYGEKVMVDDENIFQVLAAADYLQMPDAKKFCFGLLTDITTIKNCLDVLSAYNLYMPEVSSNGIYQFIGDNFDAIVQHEKLSHLTMKEFCVLLKNLSKNNDINQESMFLAITRWVSHDQENRKHQFPSLFALMDLSKLSSPFVRTEVVENTLVAENFSCLKSVIQCLATKLENLESNRSKLTKDDVAIVCLGGDKRSSVSNVYNVFAETNTTYPDLPAVLCRFSAVKENQYVYCMGGKEGSKSITHSNKMHRLNLNTKEKWEEVASMNIARAFHSSAVFEGNIVVCGGIQSRSSAEKYEIRANEWTTLQPMQQGRSGHALVVCDNCLFALGGECNARLASVERLDKLDGIWNEISSMKTSRNRLAAVSLNGAIYATGGRSTAYQVEKSVEKFIPTTNSWSNVKNMNTERWGHAACVMSGKIYVVGGKDDEGKHVSTIECYDPENDGWSVVAENAENLDGHAVIVV